MTLSRVNFFAPYESAPAGHENQLTRALLVVLRYSPMAHQAWLGLVAPEQHLHDLSKAEFATQRQRVLVTETDIPDVDADAGHRLNIGYVCFGDENTLTLSCELRFRQVVQALLGFH